MATCLDDVPVGDRYALHCNQTTPPDYSFILWCESSGKTFVGYGTTPSLAAADCLKDM